MRRIDQDMACVAAQFLEEEAPSKELRTRFRQLPVQLHNSGLAATYAFLVARSNTSGRLADIGLLPEKVKTASEPAVHGIVLQALGEMDTTRYARATAEVSLLFSWLRRLAEAVYVEEEQ